MASSKPIKLEVNKSVLNRFIHPFRMAIIGPSFSGKSTLCRTILSHKESLFTTRYSKVLYCIPEKHYETQQAFISSLKQIYPEIIIRYGPPTLSDIRSDQLPKLLILGKNICLKLFYCCTDNSRF